MAYQPQNPPAAPVGPGNPAPVPVYADLPANPPYYQNYPPGGIPMQNVYYPVPNQDVVYAGQPLAPAVTNRRLAFIYIFAAIAMAVLCFADISFPPWVRYCKVDVGLRDYTTDSGNTYTLDGAVSDNCNPDIDTCGDNCANFEKLRDAGELMNGLGIVTVISVLMSALRMLLLILRPTRWCRAILLRITLVAATLLWLLSMSIYLSNYTKVKNNHSETSIEAGLVLAIVIGILFVVNCVLGNLAVSKVAR